MRGASSRNQQAFAQLCAAGEYNEDFEHPEPAKRFVRSVVQSTLQSRTSSGTCRVLDAGTGTGAWLTEIGELMRLEGGAFELFGFDHSSDMLAVAQRRVRRCGLRATLHQGDVANRATYDQIGQDGFDLITAYDVIQQLPWSRRRGAVQLLLEHLRPDGSLVIFDHEILTSYGAWMTLKKFCTRYLGVELVPVYYTLAMYPCLYAMKARAETKGCAARIISTNDSRKRALVIDQAAAP